MIAMADGQKRSKKRRPRKGPKSRRGSPKNPFIMQSMGAVVSIVLVIFLVPLGVIPESAAIVICMIILAGMFYLMSVGQVRPRRPKRHPKKHSNQEKEPQFYTALPSTLGLTDIPEQVPTPQVKLPPRPIRAARRRRDFVTYPLAVGGGDYSDSYVQVDKDTVLRLRSEMTSSSEAVFLPGLRISSFPSSKIASVISQEIEADTVMKAQPVMAVEAEPLVQSAEAAVVQSAEATSVEAVVASPVLQPVIVEEEEDEMEFDMEWD
ncbi:MAG: hypothetical protein CXT75_07805 [Methanobacteriota archaeon]|nr:MAG: hypothetical protein CXT75_07805 [Euryarchaeota archaeon]